MKPPSIISLYRFLAFAFILGGSAYFGYVGRPAEMTLAIVAGSIALAFSHIDRIQRFKGAGFEAEMWRKLEPIVAKETEPSRQQPRSFMQLKAFGTDQETDKVIEALGSEKYAWRYFGGIAEDTQLPKGKIQKALDWLVENELATMANGKHGALWGLSTEGRSLLASVVKKNKNAPG